MSEIKPETISKLDHKILEIRQRALQSVYNKLFRGLLKETEPEYDAVVLMKMLLKWFKCVPLIDEEIVLNAMKLVLKSKYSTDIAYYFGINVLKEEIAILRNILQKSHTTLLDEIVELLNEIDCNKYQQNTVTDKGLATNNLLDDIDIDLTSLSEFEVDGPAYEYELPWSQPSQTDLHSLKLLKASLSLSEDAASMEHAVKYMPLALRDYPAEFFLQPPFIFSSLINLHKEKKAPTSNLLELFLEFLQSLKGRISTRQLVISRQSSNEFSHMNHTQFSIGKVIYDLFQVVLTHLKDISENFIETEAHLCYKIMAELIKLIEDNTKYVYKIDEILEQIAYYVKYFRQTWKQKKAIQTNRIQYILLLSFLNKLQIIKNIEETGNTEMSVSKKELLVSLFDYAIKEMYPETWELTKQAVQLPLFPEYNALKTVLHCDVHLSPVVNFMQNFNDLGTVEQIMKGLKALDTLGLHKSVELSKHLIKAIDDVSVQLDGNSNLKESVELVILKLLSCENLRIRRQIYRECVDKVKTFYGMVLDGQQKIGQAFRSDTTCGTGFLGILLTTKIITELCFGCVDEDVDIKRNAESILSLILKSRLISDSNWKSIWSSLAAVLPLIQCLHTRSGQLGKEIVHLFNPDNELDGILEANLRFLFSVDSSVRTEAFHRIVYLIMTRHCDNNQYSDIQNLSDTILNDICVLKQTIDPKYYNASNMYDKSTIVPMIEMLLCLGVEPLIRKTTLSQLNIMLQDPAIAQSFYEQKGYELVLQIIVCIMTEDQSQDYPDAIKPAIGILTKLSIHMAVCRKRLANVNNICVHLIRALFTFHLDYPFKQDCVTLLFICLNSNYVLGSSSLTMPYIFHKLNVPLKCEFHWHTSPFRKQSALEDLFRSSDSNNEYQSAVYDDSEQMVKLNEFTKRQYLRLSFASLWFGGFNQIPCKIKAIEQHKKSGQSKMVSQFDTTFDIDSILMLEKTDIALIKTTSSKGMQEHYIRLIVNSTDHKDALNGIGGLMNCLLITEVDGFEVISAVSRFCIFPPNNEMDKVLFIAVVRLLSQLMSNEDIFIWTEDIFKERSCVFLNLMASESTCNLLFSENAMLLNTFFRCVIRKEIENKVSKMSEKLINNIFENIIQMIDVFLEKREIEKLRSLVDLTQTISSSSLLNLDENFNNQVIEKLFHMVAAIKAFSQAGSSFNKNCLLTVNNIMQRVKDINIDKRYLKLLSGLGSHADFEIRACTWSILLKICSSLGGAHLIIEGLHYLPGGFHACCISTLVDNTEINIVRETAGACFASLISFGNFDDGLHAAVFPKCAEQEIHAIENGIYLVFKILKHQYFFEFVSISLDNFYASELHDTTTPNNFASYGVIRCISIILSNLIMIDPLAGQLLERNGCAYSIIKFFKQLSPINQSHDCIRMVSEICNFLTRFLSVHKHIIKKLANEDGIFLDTLLHLLKNKIEPPSLSTNILQLVTILASHEACFELICKCFANSELLKSIVSLIIVGLKSRQHKLFQMTSLKLLRTLLVMGELQEFGKNLFADLLDDIFFGALELKLSCEDLKLTRSITRKSLDVEVSFGSEKLFTFLNRVYETFNTNDVKDVVVNAFKLQVYDCLKLLLKSSSKCRHLAHTNNLMKTILNHLNSILKVMGPSCTNFVKKSGDVKKTSVINELTSIYDLLCYWHSNDCLTDDLLVGEFCKTAIQLWSWAKSNQPLLNSMLRTLIVLTQNSIVVCKTMSSNSSSPSLLNLVSEVATFEVNRGKHPQSDLEMLELSLNVLSNCAECIEGRQQLLKLNVLDVFGKLHPSVTKNQKPFQKITSIYLNFWIHFSKFPETSNVRHLHLLCTLSMCSSSLPIKMQALNVIRNMAFNPANRTALLTSHEFMYLARSLLDEGTRQEQLLIASGLWSLTANNFKAKHILRGSKIHRQLQFVLRDLTSTFDDDDDTETLDTLENDEYNLVNVLRTLTQILST